MKKILFLLIILMFANKGYCDYTITTGHSPNSQQFYGSPTRQNYYNRRSFNNLERKVLSQNYRQENEIQRLSRMEESIFGAVQSGDINSRYMALQKALRKSDYPGTYYPQKQGFWKNVLNTFSYSAGVPTGFTPPVTSGYYEDSDTPYGYQDGYYDNWGNYRNNAYSVKSGTRIKILD